MKKMTAKSMVMILTTVLVMGLAACGGKKAPETESKAESQAETEQAAEETQPVQTETEAPAGPSEEEIANAYLQILHRDEARIRAYNWQQDWNQTGKPVAITDVNGDGIPELVYACTSEEPDRAQFAADLHIYTYEADEKEAEEVYDYEMWDVAVAGGSRYLLFLENDGSFWAYSSAGDEQWTNTFERFEAKSDDDLELSLQARKHTYPDENYTTRIEEYTGPDDTEITADEYDGKKAELVDHLALAILRGNLDDDDLEAAADQADSAEMTFDEAVAYLQGKAGASGKTEESGNKRIDADTLFAEIENKDFYFASGAGAWATELEIEADGSFSGNYHDSDMGDSGTDYPNGTRYICEFEGRFAVPEKIDEYSYKLKLEDISYEKKPGTIWTEDGVRMIASEAYGMMAGESSPGNPAREFILYLPGAPTADLPQGFLDCIRMPRAWNDIPEKLPVYGLYNTEAETGFSADAEMPATESSGTNISSDQGLLPESAERLLTASDIAGMSDDDIQLAINTIYARHGYQFKDSELLQYFKGFDWYQPSESDMEKVKDSFSEIERKNMEFLAASR